ncbi:MAG: methyltransferase domain-containing protein [Bryobacteraceae bacterium]
MTPQQAREEIARLSPWFYEFDLGAYGRTESDLPPDVFPIHQTRLSMVESVIDRHFGKDLSAVRCIDVGCHEGYYSVSMARKGFKEVRGVDVRGVSLDKARFIASLLELKNLSFEEHNCEQLRDCGEPYELCLFLGVLYHLENPMLCLRNIAAVTSGICILETQVTDEVEGEVEWGSQKWTRPYHGVLALIDESDEYYNNRPETGASPIATCPSPKALHTMLRHAGFRKTEIIEPPPGAYEQLARKKRVICVAEK